MSSLITNAILFDRLKITILIKLVFFKIENKEKRTESDKEILEDGISLINKFIRAAAVLEKQTSRLNLEFPTSEEIDLIGYVFSIMKEFFPFENNLTQFFLRLKRILVNIQNENKETEYIDEIKKFFSGFEKEMRKALMTHVYTDDDDD